MLRHTLIVAAALVAQSPLAASAAPADVGPLNVAGEKAKATKASVTTLKTKLEKARDAMRALAKEAAPSGLTAEQKKTYAAEMKKVAEDAEAADKVIVKLDAGLKDAKAKLDSMSEMGEMESLRLQMAMDRLSKLMSTLSNLLKKTSDTAQSITQNLK
jgi:hypothetical protein